MRLIIQQGRVVGTAIDDYTGPETHIAAPEGFDIERMGDYVVTGDVAALPLIDLRSEIDAAMLDLFDRTAQERRYDNRITCALRAGYAGPFHADGQAFAVWMDECNALAYRLLEMVEAGDASMPASVDAALALLPAMEWPV